MKKEELIAHYFTNKLSQEAQKEFDHLMNTDSEFAKDVRFQENLKAVIQKDEQVTLKKQLQAFEKERNTPVFNYKKWLIAATIVALFGVSSFWYFNSSINTEKLYAANFEPYRNVVHPIVRGETKGDIKTKAFLAYETKNYEKALNYFDNLLSEHDDETIAFYKANVLLKLNKVDNAIAIFEENLKTSDSLNDKNQWYLALAYLKNDNITAAKQQLNGLLESNSTFKTKTVKKLLKQLD